MWLRGELAGLQKAVRVLTDVVSPDRSTLSSLAFFPFHFVTLALIMQYVPSYTDVRRVAGAHRDTSQGDQAAKEVPAGHSGGDVLPHRAIQVRLRT